MQGSEVPEEGKRLQGARCLLCAKPNLGGSRLAKGGGARDGVFCSLWFVGGSEIAARAGLRAIVPRFSHLGVCGPRPSGTTDCRTACRNYPGRAPAVTPANVTQIEDQYKWSSSRAPLFCFFFGC